MNQKRIFALLLAAAMMTVTACGQGGSSSSEQEQSAGVAVQVQQVRVQDISTENRVSGRVVAENETSVYVSTAAKCTAVYKQAGDEVKAGDKICTLDLGSTLATYNAAKITYQSAVDSYQTQKGLLDKQVALYEKVYEDTKALFGIGAASQMEVDQAELTLLSTKAQRNTTLSQLEAGMQSYKSNVEQLSLVMENIDSEGNVIAPADGIVASLSASEGGMVSNAMPVAVIRGAGQMKITVSVSEALVPKLNIGDQATVQVSAAGADFTAVIRGVDKTVNMQTQLYTVTLTVPAEVTGLLTGMFAQVTFHTNTSVNAIVVPTEAILTSNDKQYVFVVEDNTAKYVEVTTGLMGSGVTEITSGLQGGEQLVTVGQSYLADGDAVRVITGED